MSFNPFKNNVTYKLFTNKSHTYICIYICVCVCVCEQNLTLNNPNNLTIYIYIYIYELREALLFVSKQRLFIY